MMFPRVGIHDSKNADENLLLASRINRRGAFSIPRAVKPPFHFG